MKKLLTLVVVFAAVPLFGGTLIEWQIKKGNDTKQSKMLLEDNRFRTEDATTAMTFHQVNGDWVMDLWDKKSNQVRRMDQQFVDQISQQLAGVNEQLQAALANLDPQQKALMEKMMKGKMAQIAGAAAATAIVYTPTGNATVAGFACREYDGSRDNQVTRKVCAADQAALNVPASRFQVFDRMREFAAKLQSSLQNSPIGPALAGIADPGFEGIPIRQTTIEKGKTVEEQTVTKVSETAFTDSDFSNGNARLVPMVAPGGKR